MTTPTSPDPAPSSGDPPHETTAEPYVGGNRLSENSEAGKNSNTSRASTMAERMKEIDPERFYSMCSTLLTYEEEKKDLAGKNAVLQASIDEFNATLENRDGQHKQQMQQKQGEADKLKQELRTTRQRIVTFERDAAEMKTSLTDAQAKHQAKQEQERKTFEVLLEKEQKQKEQLEKDLADASKKLKEGETKQKQAQKAQCDEVFKMQQNIQQLGSDIRDAKQQAEVAEARSKLEQRRHAQRLQDNLAKESQLRLKNAEIATLRKNEAGQSRVLSHQQRQNQELSQKLAQQETRLQKSIFQLRVVYQAMDRLRSEFTYAQHHLSSAHEESEAYAIANILALRRDSFASVVHAQASAPGPQLATGRVKELQEELAETRKMIQQRCEAEKDFAKQIDLAWKKGQKDFEERLASSSEQLAAAQRILKQKDDEVAKLRVDKTELEKKLAEATKHAAVSDQSEKAAKKSANIELDKSRNEQKALRKKLESARGEVATLTKRCNDLERGLSQANADKKAFGDDKDMLNKRIAALEREVGLTKRQAKAQAEGLVSKLDDAKAQAAIARRQAERNHPKRPSYVCLDDIQDIFGDGTAVTDRILKIFLDDPENRIEVRVDGHILWRPFIPFENRLDHEIEAHQLDQPLPESKEMMQEMKSSSKPWLLSSINYNEEEQAALNEYAPKPFDLFELPLKDNADEDQHAIADDPTRSNSTSSPNQSTANVATRTPSTAAPVPEFMQGANISRTGDEHTAQREKSTVPKEGILQPLKIPKPPQKQREGASLPTPAPSEHASPRDSLLATPRSPIENDTVLHKLPKRSAPQDAPGDPRSPKRPAPSDHIARAPRGPRSLDARSADHQNRPFRPFHDHRRVSAFEDSRGDHYHPQYPVPDPGGREARRESVREDESTRDCYNRRW